MSEPLVAIIEEKRIFASIKQETYEAQINGKVVYLTSNVAYVDETPSGNIDGINVEYFTTYDYKINSTTVFVNGLKQIKGIDYVENGGKKITMAEPLISDGYIDKINITYEKDIIV